MRKITGKRRGRVLLICLSLLALAPLNSYGKLYLETDTATGVATDISSNIITLDSGEKFYPATDNTDKTDLDVQTGTTITVRYYTDGEGKNRYTQVAGGRNSLHQSFAPEVKEGGFK